MRLSTLDKMVNNINENIEIIKGESLICLSQGEYKSYEHLQNIENKLIDIRLILDNSIILQYQLLPKGSTVNINLNEEK